MTVGGTGDVLAGVTGALLAVSAPFPAACAAVYANGVAGERATAGRDRGLVAADLLGELPAALGGEGGDRV
jgi:NAD(P)H-hydrate epimerase